MAPTPHRQGTGEPEGQAPQVRYAPFEWALCYETELKAGDQIEIPPVLRLRVVPRVAEVPSLAILAAVAMA